MRVLRREHWVLAHVAESTDESCRDRLVAPENVLGGCCRRSGGSSTLCVTATGDDGSLIEQIRINGYLEEKSANVARTEHGERYRG